MHVFIFIFIFIFVVGRAAAAAAAASELPLLFDEGACLVSEVLSSSSEQVQQQEDSSNIDYRCATAQDRQAFSSMVNEYHRREQGGERHDCTETPGQPRKAQGRPSGVSHGAILVAVRWRRRDDPPFKPTDEALKSVELKVGVKVRKKFDGARGAFDGEVVAIAHPAEDDEDRSTWYGCATRTATGSTSLNGSCGLLVVPPPEQRQAQQGRRRPLRLLRRWKEAAAAAAAEEEEEKRRRRSAATEPEPAVRL